MVGAWHIEIRGRGCLKLLLYHTILYHTITLSLHAWSWIPHYCVVANGLRAPRVSVSGHLDRFSGLLKFHVLLFIRLNMYLTIMIQYIYTS